jgi:GDP-D-mannose dehydratase
LISRFVDFPRTLARPYGRNQTGVGFDYRDHVVTDSELYRPAELDLLIGNSAKARAELGWSSKTRFEDLVRLMVEADCRAQGIESKMALGARRADSSV